MSELRRLEHEDFVPCMECGSVQCAVCSDKLIKVISWLKQELRNERQRANAFDSLVGLGASKAYDVCISGLNTVFECILNKKEGEVK